MENITTYRDYESSNAVKLLPIIKSLGGYIQLYTELDSHIEVGDYIYITYSGNTDEIDSGFDIDNYVYINNSDEYNIYNDYAQGYEVVYVNDEENSFAINRYIYTLTNDQNLTYAVLLDGYYVSSISAQNINIYGGSIESIVLKIAEIEPLINDIDMIQCVMFSGEVTNVILDDKYESSHRSLKLQYDGNVSYSKYFCLNNDNYGYSYFYNLTNTINNCEIYGNTYYNCRITADTQTTLDGGYFEECNISGYTIDSGYFLNSTLDTNCIWNYGYWNSPYLIDGVINPNFVPFTLDWNNGIFVDGIFGNSIDTIWKNGSFLNGEWIGLEWQGGKFINGTLIGVDYISSGETIVSRWNSGKFVNGVIDPVGEHLVWFDGVVNGGIINNTTFDKVNIYNGTFDNCVMKYGNIYNGTFNSVLLNDLNIYNGIFQYIYDGTTNQVIDRMLISKCKIYGGDFSSLNSITSTYLLLSHIYNCEIYGGYFNNMFFSYPSDFYNGKFDNCKISDALQLLNKAIIKIKKLFDGVVEKKVIVIYFPNGHPYSLSNVNVGDDIGKFIQLRGFNSPELNIDTQISDTHYTDSNNDDYDNIGDGYITIDYPGEDWFFDNTGVVYSKQCYTNHEGEYNIYNGTYNSCNIHQYNNNINIIYGLFNFGVMDFDQHNNGIYNYTEINGVRYATPYTIDYKANYNLLRERKLYYDIAPWDYSNDRFDNIFKK